ncbi:mannosyltransferase, partial [bacterium]|nr:mannosyltransferase [bacterium]
MIPKIIHFIWVGDESKRPDRFIQTWVDHHPGWEIKLWGNEDLASRPWINGHHMAEMAKREWNGAAALMRWEILHAEGGILVDADSVCVRPLPEWLLECEAFACWENEIVRPGLIAAGYFGTGPAFLAALIEGIRQQPTVTDRQAWMSVGPLHLTKTWNANAYGNLTLLPSHFFMPTHHTGETYTGGGPVYAHQAWASTGGTYDLLADPDPSPRGAPDLEGAEPASQAFLFEPLPEDSEG